MRDVRDGGVVFHGIVSFSNGTVQSVVVNGVCSEDASMVSGIFKSNVLVFCCFYCARAICQQFLRILLWVTLIIQHCKPKFSSLETESYLNHLLIIPDGRTGD